MENRRLITEFNKNSIETVKVMTYKWKGQHLIDVRVWILQDPTDPESTIPTKKGLTLRIDSLPELIDALEKAREVLDLASQRPQETSLGQG